MAKRIIALCLAALFVLCSSGCGEDDVNDLLGAGTPDYSAEESVGDIENATLISEMTSIVTALTVNSIDFPEFSSPGEIIATCQDAILNYMLASDYARFSGSTKLLSEIAEKYPDMTVTAAIGSKDYESALYRLFSYSGTVRHGETKRFTYLSKAKAYTPAAPATASRVALDIQSAYETEHSYQMSFFALLDEEISPLYNAVFIKKDNGMYLRSLTRGRGEKINVSLDKTIS